MSCQQPSDDAAVLVPLGDTGWVLWRDAAVRGTGFPARQLLEICDDDLAAAADALDALAAEADAPAAEADAMAAEADTLVAEADTLVAEADDAVAAEVAESLDDRYAEAFGRAAGRLSAAIRRTAADSRFREALTWQNPALVPLCLDKAVAGRRRDSRGRAYELTIANYLQRFALKNDSVGFFGPVGWAGIGPEDAGLTAVPGPELLARRTTSFEPWAIDAVAEALAGRPEVWPWLRPRMVPHASLTGWVLQLPLARPATLTAAEVRLVRRCDGSRTVRDLVGEPADVATLTALLRLRERGVVLVDLSGAHDTGPERALAARIAAIGDPRIRERAAAPLDELIAARDAVAAAAGRPAALTEATRALAETFERITGRAATRLAGRFYVGRNLVCEDTLRAADVHIGRRVTDRLAPPLGLVLDSALWLVNTLGRRYESRAAQILDRELARTGAGSMPLLPLMAEILPELLDHGRTSPDSAIVDEVTAELQQRWRRVLGLPPEPAPTPEPAAGVRRHTVTTAAIAARAATEFATGPPLWSGVRWHSPDVMIAAADPAALARGDVDFVLGELHCGANTLESRIFAAQHEAPERLRAAAEASRLTGRVVFVPRRGADRITARLSPAADVLLPGYTYVCTGPESFTPPAGATVLSVMDLSVARHDGKIVVRHRGGAEWPLLEVLGQPLILFFLSGYRPVGGGRHRPRVTIDRLVLSREAWRFPAADLAWAFDTDEAARYAGARRWRAANGLPERGFFQVPVERKPMAVDFRSLVLVGLLAKAVRRTAAAGGGDVTITEMLPDLDGLWLTDAKGERYTSELRIVAVRSPSTGIAARSPAAGIAVGAPSAG